MPNRFSGQIIASAPATVSVGNISTSLLAANFDRVGLVVVNSSGGTIYLGLDGATALLNAGITLNPNGGTWVMDDYTYTKGAINAIAHSAATQVGVQEFYEKF